MPKAKIWEPSNIYETAIIGDDVSIGAFSEIGHLVVIGPRTRVGAMCFIPEGVWIGEDCFIGPRVTFTNDKHPPSLRQYWQSTVVKRGAKIGAAATILCGLEIGEGATVGAGSVVTQDIPKGEVWCGVPARRSV
jgi:acetyltransferase-like isoleucine patch superfamily enzyme